MERPGINISKGEKLFNHVKFEYTWIFTNDLTDINDDENFKHYLKKIFLTNQNQSYIFNNMKIDKQKNVGLELEKSD
jgi:hypothetical protein